MRYYGIRTVVLHLKMPKLPGIVGYALAEPPDVPAAAAKPIAGLGVTRRRVGSLVIYRSAPGRRLRATDERSSDGPAGNRAARSAWRRAGGGVSSRRFASPIAASQPGASALAAILLVGLAYATMIQSFSWNQSLALRT